MAQIITEDILNLANHEDSSAFALQDNSALTNPREKAKKVPAQQ